GKNGGERLQVIEHWNDGEKNSEEEPAHLLGGSKREFIGRMHTFWCCEIRSGGSREHDCFAEKWRALDENRAENDREKENVAQALDVDLASSGFFFTNDSRRAAKIMSIDEIKYQKQNEQRDRPGQPEVLNHPPKRHAFEISKKT